MSTQILPTRIWPIILSFLILISCGRGKETTQVRQATLTEAVYASGIIRSKYQYKVYPSVNGVIQEVRVSEGDIVKKGTILFVLRGESAKLNTETAELN